MKQIKKKQRKSLSRYETIRIELPREVCRRCDSHAERLAGRPVAIVSCEGAGLRGEVARRAANLVCLRMAPEDTARICLGASFSREGGPRKLVRHARQVIVIEGCSLQCASRMMKGAVPGLKPTVMVADRLYQFDRNLVGIAEMPDRTISRHARTVAAKANKKVSRIVQRL